VSRIAIVEAFVTAWNAMDFSPIYAVLANGAVWQIMPMAPAHDHRGVRAFLDSFPIKGCDWHIHAIAEANDQLLTKWSDRFLLATGTSTKMPVMGIFAFDAARRCRVWRGYFNWGQFQMEFAK